MYGTLYAKIQQCCGYVTVMNGEDVISEGTCFAFTADGEIITAAHVVTGRFPIRVEDYQDPNIKILVKFAGRNILRYKVSFCGISVACAAFNDVIQLDIACLSPIEVQESAFPFLPASIEAPHLGPQLFIAGYSDELSLPFNLDRIANKSFPGVDQFVSAMKTGYMADMMGAIVKRAIVGNHRSIHVDNTLSDLVMKADVFYMDNGMNVGASGGPVVNEKGEAVGVITQRAVTTASQQAAPGLAVPSGATIGLSLAPIEFVREWRSREKARSL